MSSPTIGVVVAVRDQAQYLDEALDSIERQTRPPDDVIVVDDQSSDGTGDVARGRGLRTVDGPGRGPAAARNRGAVELSTDLITILDGDDRFEPWHHEELLAGIGEAAAVAGLVRQFYDPGREAELAARHPLPQDPMPGAVPGAMLIRKAVFDSLGGFPDGETEHEFFTLLRGLGQYPKIDRVVLERRIHGANRSIVDRGVMRAHYLRSARAAILAARAAAGEGDG